MLGNPCWKKLLILKQNLIGYLSFSLKNTPRKLKTFSFFCGNFFCSVFWYCTIVLKMRMHSGKFRQISQSARIFFNWMESGFWLKLIENITVEIPNTASISKDILFHVSEFLEKIVFQLMFEIIKWIRQFQTVPNCWCRIRQIFSTRTRVLVLKQKFLYLLDFDQRTSFITNFKVLEQRCCLNLSETRRQLKFSKSFIPMWLLWQYLETAGDSI